MSVRIGDIVKMKSYTDSSLHGVYVVTFKAAYLPTSDNILYSLGRYRNNKYSQRVEELFESNGCIRAWECEFINIRECEKEILNRNLK